MTSGRIREISAIDHKKYQGWVSGIDELSLPQKEQTQDLLSGVTGENASLMAIETQLAETRQCPHCNTAGAIAKGVKRGLRRYQCKACKKTFNAATGTALQGLHKKGQVAHLWRLPRQWVDSSKGCRALQFRGFNLVSLATSVFGHTGPEPFETNRHCRG